MLRGFARRDDPVSAAAFTTLFAWDVVQAFTAAMLAVEVDVEPAVVMVVGFGTVILATAALAATVAQSARTFLPVAAILLVASRLILPVAATGPTRLVVAGIGTVAGGVALGALAATARSGHRVRIGVLVGLAGWAVMRAALGDVDLHWRGGWSAWAALGVLATAALFAVATTTRSRATAPQPPRFDAAWPWWSLGLTVYVVATTLTPTGRVAVASGWPDPWPVVAVVVLSGLLILGAVLGQHHASRQFILLSGGLVTVGAVAAMRPVALVAVAGQGLLALGIGALVGAAAPTGRTGTRLRAAAAGGLVACLLVMLAQQLSLLLLPVPFASYGTLAVAAVLVAAITLLGMHPATTSAIRPRPTARPVGGVVAATACAALLAALVAPRVAVDPPSVPDEGTILRIVAVDITRGFDHHGRFDAHTVATELAALTPDVVIVGEVDRGSHTGGGPDTLRVVQRELGLAHAFAPAAGDLRGNAVLSRLPIVNHTAEQLPQGRDPIGRSNIIAVVEMHPQRPVTVIGTHLSDGAAFADTRIPQARATAATVARLRDRGLAVIVAGSLNAAPGSVEINSFGDILTMARSRADTATDGSLQAGVDSVMLSPELTVVATDQVQLGRTGRAALVVDVRMRVDDVG